MKTSRFIWILVGASFASACATTAQTDWASMSPAARVKAANRVADKCHLRREEIAVVGGDGLRFSPNPNAAYENVDCALGEFKRFSGIRMGFVGNEMNEDAVLPKPFEYIVGGSLAALETVAAQVRQAGWVVEKLAKADDGTGFLVFRTPDGATYRQAQPFMDRLLKHQLGDITFGPSPSKNGSYEDE